MAQSALAADASAPPCEEASTGAVVASAERALVSGFLLPAVVRRDADRRPGSAAAGGAGVSLQACLDAFAAPEQLRVATGDGYRCENCARQQAPTLALGGSPPLPTGGVATPLRRSPRKMVGPASARGEAPTAAAQGHEAAAPCVADASAAAPSAPGPTLLSALPQDSAAPPSALPEDSALSPAAPLPETSAAPPLSPPPPDHAAASCAPSPPPPPPPPPRDATKRILMGPLMPAVLTLHLKRFSSVWTGSGSRGGARLAKVQQHVAFPEVLDLTEYVALRAPPEAATAQAEAATAQAAPAAAPAQAATAQALVAETATGAPLSAPGSDAPPALEAAALAKPEDAAPQPPPPPQRMLYRLLGLVVHSGGLSSGHYVACVRRESSRGGDSQWVLISDSMVSQVSLAEVLSQQAYVLFYERIA